MGGKWVTGKLSLRSGSTKGPPLAPLPSHQPAMAGRRADARATAKGLNGFQLQKQVKIESGTQVASRGSDMAHCDAAGVNGSNRIKLHGAPLLRMMPNGCLESSVLVLLRS